ncbi:MAG: hypothetical protein H8D96_07180 [Desulfobacterales bacterium]|uniref:Uncharacterized protein n=1 Tax=Candidatus Desulfatibia vada TaxID=2841696 RepID=A0A8J6P221_9BACT|nr:hypothetical protein [Candidatus Desulfatibia vada]
MGTGIRVFFVDENEALKRIPLTRYERLLGADPEVRFQEYAGKRVRYALVILEIVNRKPAEIVSIQYSILSFDSDGRIDAGELEKEMKLGFKMLQTSTADVDSPNVINAKDRFAMKRYHDQYTWTPSSEVERAVVAAIFGTDKK